MKNQDWINNKIYWLTATLSVNNDLFHKNYDSVYALYPYFESGKTEDAQKAVNLISKNLEMTPPLVHYDWSGELDNESNLKGQMTMGQLTVSITFTNNKFLLAATVVHELMHYFLIHRKNISLLNGLENEKLTDLAAIVLGFETIMLNGKIIGWEKEKINTLGYLSFEEIAYACQKVHTLRNLQGYVHLNSYASQIINGSISNLQNTQYSYDSGINLKYLNTTLHLLYKYTKNFFIILIRSFSDIIKPSLKKTCPFCHKNIQKDTFACKFCGRTLKEKI